MELKTIEKSRFVHKRSLVENLNILLLMANASNRRQLEEYRRHTTISSLIIVYFIYYYLFQHLKCLFADFLYESTCYIP